MPQCHTYRSMSLSQTKSLHLQRGTHHVMAHLNKMAISTHTHTHTHTHKNTPTPTHTHTHIETQTHPHPHTHTHTPTSTEKTKHNRTWNAQNSSHRKTKLPHKHYNMQQLFFFNITKHIEHILTYLRTQNCKHNIDLSRRKIVAKMKTQIKYTLLK